MSETKTQVKSEVLAQGQQQNELLEQLLKPEVQASLTSLIEQLPQLTELVGMLTKSYEVTKTLANDDVLKSDIVNATSEILGPIVGSAKNLAANVIEAKDRAEASQEEIGVFGLLKMLKDPQTQKLLRFVNAFLQVSNERSK